jgi:hypothetical protein
MGQEAANKTKFMVGTTYGVTIPSAGCGVYPITILKRTEKTVTLRWNDRPSDMQRVKIRDYHRDEEVLSWESYYCTATATKITSAQNWD